MAESILADTHRHSTTEDIRLAIQQRTTRGMLTYNTGKVHRLEGELWAVPSARGGFHKVSLAEESCDCEDFSFYGAAAGVGCRRFHAAAIERDRGWVYLGFETEENGELVEIYDRVPCRRCHYSETL